MGSFSIHLGGATRKKGQKGTPSCLVCNNFFDDGIKWKKWIRSKKEVTVDAAKDLFRDMFYVKALDTGWREERGWNLGRCWNPKRTTNNTQQVYTIINYILFYGTKLGHGIISVVLKRRKKGTKGLLTASFCLRLQPKGPGYSSRASLVLSPPISFWCPNLKVKDLPYYAVPPRFYL